MEKKKVFGWVAIAISAVSAVGAAIYAGTKFLHKKKQEEELIDDFDINKEDIELNPNAEDLSIADENIVEVDLADVELVNEAVIAEDELAEVEAEEVLAFEKAAE